MTDRFLFYPPPDNKIRDCGMVNLEEMKRKTTFIKIKENHQHDVTITQEPPYYQL